MKLSILGIRDKGILDKERVTLKAKEATLLASYIMVGSFKGEDSSFWFDCGFWFPSTRVKGGDAIVVYTKSGTHKTKVTRLGTMTYFYYLGRNEPYWSQGRVLGLIEIADADSYSPLMQDEELEE